MAAEMSIEMDSETKSLFSRWVCGSYNMQILADLLVPKLMGLYQSRTSFEYNGKYIKEQIENSLPDEAVEILKLDKPLLRKKNR